MKGKRIFSLILTAAMALTMIPSTAFANEGINTEEALTAAVSAAVDKQETIIKLDSNITLSNTLKIPSNKSIVLDLNGNKLGIKSSSEVIDNSGTLTVKNGVMSTGNNGTSANKAVITNAAEGVLTIEQDDSKETMLIGDRGIKNSGKAFIHRGIIKGHSVAYQGIKGSLADIYGGELTSPGGSQFGRAINNEGVVNIYGGKFYSSGKSGTGDNYMNAIGVFHGGRVTIDPADGAEVSVISETDYAVSTRFGASMVIKGGSFACNGSRDDISDDGIGSIEVTGGSFKHAVPSKYIKEGYVAVKGDESYTVHKMNAITDAEANSYDELVSLTEKSIFDPVRISLGSDITIPASADLTLKSGFKLMVPEGVTLTVNGILRLEGSLVNNGTLTVNNSGFIENPLAVSGRGSITDYPEAKDGVCEISTPMQLQWLSRITELKSSIPEYIKLTKDIHLPDVSFTPIGNESKSYKNSVFDGAGHEITGIDINVSPEYTGGMFGAISDATIKNLTISDSNIRSASSYIGTLAGFAGGNCDIRNVNVKNGSVTSDISYGVGGLIGRIYTTDKNDTVEFISCSFDGNIRGYANVGGLWGTSTSSLGKIGIYNCSLNGKLDSIDVNGAACGGFAHTAVVTVIGLDNTAFDVFVDNKETDKLLSAEGNAQNDVTKADSDKYQAVKNGTGEWISANASDPVEAAIDGIPYRYLTDAVSDTAENDTILLKENVSIDSMLTISMAGVTLDLNNHRISASNNFEFDKGNSNSCHLINIEADNVTIKDGTLRASDGNKHVVNVYGSRNIVLDDLVLDHTNGATGAPLVVNGSDVTLKGDVKLITGSNSWYGMNVDSGEIDGEVSGSSVNVSQGSSLSFEGKAPVGIHVENNKDKDGAEVTLTFGKDVNVNSDIKDFVAISTTDQEGNKSDVVINNPENAGLDMNESGTSEPHKHKTELRNQKKASCTEEGYEGDLVCTVCGDIVKKGNVIAKLPHDFQNGKCTMCGLSKTDAAAQTGDEANIVLTLAIMLTAAAAISGLSIYGRRKHSR